MEESGDIGADETHTSGGSISPGHESGRGKKEGVEVLELLVKTFKRTEKYKLFSSVERRPSQDLIADHQRRRRRIVAYVPGELVGHYFRYGRMKSFRHDREDVIDCLGLLHELRLLHEDVPVER